MDGITRRQKAIISITERTGVDEEMIARLVHEFYSRVRADGMLAPIFDSRIADWDAHLARMRAFWSSVALFSGRYHGRPMDMHISLPVEEAHFKRWLEIFRDAAYDICPPAAAEYFIDRARKVAASLQQGIEKQADERNDHA